MKVILSQCIMF